MTRNDGKQAKLAVAVGAAALLGQVCAQGPVPPAQPAGAPGMCVVPGWEYAPRWSIEGNGFSAPDQASCAQDCADDPACAGATWIEFDTFTNQKNCWFKEWDGPTVATPCEPDPSTTGSKTFNALIKAADCTALQYKSEPMLCEAEMDLPKVPVTGMAEAPGATTVAATPMAAADGPMAAGGAVPDETELMGLATPYMAFGDIDYSPDDVTPGATTVEDLEPLTTATATECAQACIANADCNGATWMGANPAWDKTKNCFLKAFGTPCVEPAEAVPVPGAYILMAQGPDCEGVPMAVAPMAEPPMAGLQPLPAAPVAPMPAAPPAQPPIGFAGTTRGVAPQPAETDLAAQPPASPLTGSGTDTQTTPVETGPASGAVSLRGAVSVAAAVAVFAAFVA